MRERHWGRYWGRLDPSAIVSANSLTWAVYVAVSTVVLRFFDAMLVPTVILGKAGGREPDGIGRVKDGVAGSCAPSNSI